MASSPSSNATARPASSWAHCSWTWQGAGRWQPSPRRTIRTSRHRRTVLGTVLVDDTDLAASWFAQIDTVPTLVRRRNGVEVDRLAGWDVEQWRAFLGDALTEADELPPYRPGCGSLSVDPDRVDALEARYGDGLASARVELASAEDPFEAMIDRGWSDGLPLVPPTPERVAAMLAGTSRAAHDIVAVVPPDLVECTVEKVAVNAVMAGCRPEYLPVVIAALEAICTDEFNIHGVLATTMPVGPVLIVNGPIRHAIGMNSGGNALGQGNRANLTIGRAVQLVVRNVGGGAPGGVDRATLGNPGKIGFCFAEDEEGSPFEPLSVAQGFAPGTNTVTVFAGEGPRCVVDQLTRDADGLARSLAMALNATTHPKLVLGFDAILVLSPEHAARFADAGWSRSEVIDAIVAHSVRPADAILRGVDGIAEGVPRTRCRRRPAQGPTRRRSGPGSCRRRGRPVLCHHRGLGDRRHRQPLSHEGDHAMTVLLDPTAEHRPASRPAAPRLASLSGATVALLDISKPRGDVFLDRIEELLVADGVTVDAGGQTDLHQAGAGRSPSGDRHEL